MNGALIAVSITDLELRAAEFETKEGSPVMRNSIRIKAGEDGQPTGSFNISRPLRSFVDKLQSETRTAVLVLSSQDLFFHEFSFPFNNPRKIQNAITFELSSDDSNDDFILDHVKSVNREPGFFNFIAAQAVRKKLKEKVRQIEAAGLNIIGITADISTLGLYFQEEDEALVMETGQGYTLFVLYNQGIPVILRTIPIGLNSLGESGQDPERNNQLTRIEGEIKRTVHSFNTKTGLQIGRIWITGAIPSRDRSIEVLKKRLNLEFSLRLPADAGIRIDDTLLKEKDMNIFSSLLGATLIKRKNGSFDFMKEEFLGAASNLGPGAYLRRSAMVLVLFLLIYILSSALDLAVLNRRHDFLSSEIRQTFLSAFPNVSRIEDEVKQARNLLSAQQPGGTALANLNGRHHLIDVMHLMSTTIPSSIYFQIISIFWETGKMEIQGRTDSFKTVNTIQKLLTSNRNFTEVSISNARHREDSSNVEFKITIRLGK
jgi:Tfp pilus assembly protein PilN